MPKYGIKIFIMKRPWLNLQKHSVWVLCYYSSLYMVSSGQLIMLYPLYWF